MTQYRYVRAVKIARRLLGTLPQPHALFFLNGFCHYKLDVPRLIDAMDKPFWKFRMAAQLFDAGHWQSKD